jgi:ribonuclease HI
MNNSKTPKVSFINQHRRNSQEHGDNSVVIFCDGAGSRPDGKGSGFAWIQPRTGKRHVERVDGLTNNQAEYLALSSALNFLHDGSTAQVFTDSQLLWAQMVGRYKVHDTELAELLSQVRDVIKKKELKIDLQWVPRQKNLAGKLL